MLEWNVFVEDWNGSIKTFNIFDHGRFYADLVKIRKKYGKRNATNLDRVIFEDRVKSTMMYYFWSKCEWEVVITHWPPHIEDKKRFSEESEKVDVYRQVMLNWQQFIIYLWACRADLKERKR